MSPASGTRPRGRDALAEMIAEVERVNALPLPQLAAEVMIRGFGPGGPGALGTPGTLEVLTVTKDPLATRYTIAAEFTPAYRAPAVRNRRPALKLHLENMIGEGLQLLEHACLIQAESYDHSLCYLATRFGRAALERDAVTRILHGGSL